MEIKAYAKVNLTLEVLGRRSDGYHQVMTILQTVDLTDRLFVEVGPHLRVECSQTYLSGEANLAWRAAQALRKAAGVDQGARIYLEKNMPASMGLGGGSSDAAATLLALNGLWDLGLSACELESIARTLGADVPFFLRGGTALGQERGDVIESLRPLEGQRLVLLCPAIPIPGKTAHLYSLLREGLFTDGEATRLLTDAINGGGFSPRLLFNVFEQVATMVFPGLDRIMDAFHAAGAASLHLSGTGPALYSLVSTDEQGETVRDDLVRKGYEAYFLTTVGPLDTLTRDSGDH